MHALIATDGSEVSLDAASMAIEVALLIGLPFAAGLAIAWRWPAVCRATTCAG